MRRLAIYLWVVILLVGLLIATPAAWATPGQSRHGQTVPTPTPRGAEPPRATPVPPPQQPPPATPVPPPPEPTTAPQPAALPTATLQPAPALFLVKEVDRAEAWPGVTLHYTLTLTNQGNGSAREVSLTDTLPEGLDPGELLSEGGASWEGRTLRTKIAILPPGATLSIAFSALVRADVAVGTILVNRAEATAADGSRAEAAIWVALPPAELPPTGNCH